MINLHESMVPGRDRTRDPWICSQTHICSQTRYRLRYAARYISYASRTFIRRYMTGLSLQGICKKTYGWFFYLIVDSTIKFCSLINPFKPSVVFVGHRQIVQCKNRHSAAFDQVLHCLLTEYFIKIGIKMKHILSATAVKALSGYCNSQSGQIFHSSTKYFNISSILTLSLHAATFAVC